MRWTGVLWPLLLGLGVALGVVGMLATAEHLLIPEPVRERVGFALLAPAAVLGVLEGHLLWEARSAVRDD